MKIALAQFNAIVGDLEGNVRKIRAMAEQAAGAGATLLVTPELAVSGYPPEDLSLRPDFYRENARYLERLAADLPAGITAVVGFPFMDQTGRFNAAAVLHDGRVEAVYRKHRLPNNSVFDEVRTFMPGHEPLVFERGGIRFGVNICEDIWQPDAVRLARDADAECLLVLNASPYHKNKQPLRHAIARQRVDETGLAIVYVNLVGGQDELVFDGGSFAVDSSGELTAQFPLFQEGLYFIDLEEGVPKGEIHALPDLEACVYQALVLGVHDYVDKNGFPGVIVGSSGGVDSALTLCVAVDALGPERVQAVMMPSQYTAGMSLDDARELATNLEIRHSILPIRPMFDSFRAALAEEFHGLPEDLTEENIQARVRGVLLMALENLQPGRQ